MSLRSMLLDVDVTNPVDSTSDDLTTSISLESEVLEIVELEKEIQAHEDMVDHLALVANGIERIIDAVENSCQDGGLDRNAAAILKAATEDMVVPLGFDNPILSLESYGASGESLSATRVSVESLKEMFDKIWAALNKVLTTIRNKMTQWYKAVFDGATKLKAKADDIGKKSANLNNKKMENDKFEMDIGRLRMGSGDSLTVNDVTKGLGDVANICSNVFTRQANGVDGVSSGVLNDLKSVGSNGGDKFPEWSAKIAGSLIAAANKSAEVIGTVDGTVPSGKAPAGDSGLDAKATKTLLGNSALIFKFPKADDDPGKVVVAFNSSGWEIAAVEKSDSGKVDVPTADGGQIKAITDAISDIASSMMKYKPGSEKITKAKSNVEKGYETFTKDVGKMDEDAIDASFCSRLANTSAKLVNLCDDPAKLIMDHAMKSSLAALSYCTMSMSQYK